MTDTDPFDALPHEETAPRGRRHLLVGAILVIVIFSAFSVTAWFAYNRGFYSASDELAPVVRADDGPTRVRPDTPGGLDIPDQDKLVFDRIAPGQAEPTVERLLPEPEQPLPVPEADTAAVIGTPEPDNATVDATVDATVNDATDDTIDTADQSAPDSAIADAVPPPPPVSGLAAPEVEEIVVAEPEATGGLNLDDVLAAISEDRPLPGSGATDGADGAASEAVAGTTATAPVATPDAPAAPAPPAEVAAADSAPAAPIDPPVIAAATPEPAPEPTVESVPLPEPPAEVAATTATSPAVVPAAGGTWRIQLASVRDQSGAEQEWGRLQTVHPDLLGSLALSIQRADLDAGTFYRIQAGPLANGDAARKLCADLVTAKQDCLIVQP